MSDKNDTPMFRQAPQPGDLVPYGYDDDEIDLKELFLVLWAGRWIIAGVTALGGAIAVVVALSLPNIYTSSALLAPAESSGGGMSELMKQYGGLASLAGVSLPGGGDSSKAALAMELMKSRAFLGEFIERHDILPELMAAESWDIDTDELGFDDDVYDVESNTWVRDVDPPKQPKPSLQEAHEEFIEILGVSEDTDTGFVTVTIEHISPTIAQRWVTWLVDDINKAVRDQDVAQANRSIDYLREQVATTALSELQSVFFELIQSQTETVMLAQVRPEYVFKTIDPAIIPEEESKPNRLLIVVVGVLLGAVLGMTTVLLKGHPTLTRGDRSSITDEQSNIS